MRHNAKKIIRNFQVLPDIEKTKDLDTKAKKLARFGVQSIKKLQELNKKGNRVLVKSMKLRNELGI